MSCKANMPNMAVVRMVIAIKFAKFLFAKSLKLDHRYLISSTAFFCWRVKSSKQILTVFDEVF